MFRIMDEKERRSLIDLYEKRLEEYEIDIRTVGWSSRAQQLARFEALCQIADLTDKTLLDVGCGFGDLYSFLLRKKIQIKDYKGIDFSSRMIEIARNMHSDSKHAEFEVIDLYKSNIDEDFEEGYDYVIASGIFSFPIKDNVGYLQKMIEKMFKISHFGVAVNMPTTYVDYRDKSLYYFAPEEVFSFCKSLTKRVTLRHDYMPYEFTIHLYKDEFIDKDNVFREFRNISKINSNF